MPQRRYAMSAHVSAESRRAWKQITDSHHVNFAALIEVLPATLKQLSRRQWDELAAAARAVETERRRRAPTPDDE